jgi:hypothetical protein
MPIVVISHKAEASAESLERLRAELPVLVSRALDCPEEPYDGNLEPGDIVLRSLAALPREERLDYLIEIRTRWTESRSENLQERSDELREAVAAFGFTGFGVWIELVDGAWAQAPQPG